VKKTSLPKSVKNQVYHYLLDVFSIAGVQHPISIATYWHQWQFFWLPRSQTELKLFGKRNTTEFLEQAVAGVQDAEPIAYDDDSDDGGSGFDGDRVVRRVLCQSRVYEYNDENLIPTLLSFLLFARISAVKYPTFSANEEHVVTVVDKNGWHRSHKTFPANFLLQWRMPRPQTKSFFLMKPLGRGRDGNVFKACNAGGYLVAIKFLYGKPKKDKGNGDSEKEAAFDKAKQECERWNKIGDKAHVEWLHGYPALILPYVPSFRCVGTGAGGSLGADVAAGAGGAGVCASAVIAVADAAADAGVDDGDGDGGASVGGDVVGAGVGVGIGDGGASVGGDVDIGNWWSQVTIAHQWGIRDAIKNFSSHGYYHADLKDEAGNPKVHHIGVQESCTGAGALKVVMVRLLDLSDVEEDWEPARAESQMLADLRIPAEQPQPATPSAKPTQSRLAFGSPL